MGAHSHLSKGLTLEPADIPPPEPDAVRQVADEPAPAADPQRDLRMTTADEFLAAAAKEYEAGRIDRALWRQSLEQFGKDPSLVIAAYLRARAKALKPVNQPDPDSPIQSPRPAPDRHGAAQRGEAAANTEIRSTDGAAVRPRGARQTLLYASLAAAALASAATLAYLMVSPRPAESGREQVVSAVSLPRQTAPPKPPAGEQPAAVSSSRGASEASTGPDIAATVQQLREAGNWNVLVLYAAEWTRKEPNNPVAWNSLSIGYSNLRQYNDALDAAGKAVQLTPEDAVAWRNLGQINLTVDRLPEAGAAFARALTINPGDADSRCGAASVAQRQARPKGAGASAGPLGPADGRCPDPGNAENVAVSASVPVVRKVASPRGR